MNPGYLRSGARQKKYIHKKSFENPYFKKTPKKKNNRMHYEIAIFLLAVGAWIYFLLFSSVFKIKEWEINGLQLYKDEEISAELKNYLGERRMAIFPNENIFIFNGEKFKQTISSGFAFKTIGVKKYYPNKVIIKFEEKQQKAAIYNGNKIYIVSDDGTTILKKEGINFDTPALTDDSGATSTAEKSITPEMLQKILAHAVGAGLPPYPIFCDAWFDTANLQIGERYLGTDKLLTELFAFADNVATKTDLGLTAIVIQKNKLGPDIIVYTKNNWTIYINEKESGEKQFLKLQALLGDRLKDRGQTLEYIDLRFGDRVYIK